MLSRIHHVAIICSDYDLSKSFYTEILGLDIIQEHYREERDSYKCDLGLNGEYVIELFSFHSPPKRLSHPEATGLRHLAFAVNSVEDVVLRLENKGLTCEPIRTDPYSSKRYTFFEDPDGLPIELYEE